MVTVSRIEYIKRMIDAQIGKIHSIGDIADQTNRSSQTIRKEFAKAEHLPLSDYIRRTRVEKAEQLLCQTKLTCCEVCYAVGFTRPEVAMRAFKRITGLTMKEFRQDRQQCGARN